LPGQQPLPVGLWDRAREMVRRASLRGSETATVELWWEGLPLGGSRDSTSLERQCQVTETTGSGSTTLHMQTCLLGFRCSFLECFQAMGTQGTCKGTRGSLCPCHSLASVPDSLASILGIRGNLGLSSEIAWICEGASCWQGHLHPPHHIIRFLWARVLRARFRVHHPCAAEGGAGVQS